MILNNIIDNDLTSSQLAEIFQAYPDYILCSWRTNKNVNIKNGISMTLNGIDKIVDAKYIKYDDEVWDLQLYINEIDHLDERNTINYSSSELSFKDYITENNCYGNFYVNIDTYIKHVGIDLVNKRILLCEYGYHFPDIIEGIFITVF